jgi:glucosyl-3-phosphoglycerate synthase
MVLRQTMATMTPHELADDLLALKATTGLSVAVCIPARNEVGTVGALVASILDDVTGFGALIDELLVVDDGSDDDTSAAALAAGARVVRAGAPHGKGRAMTQAIDESTADLIVFLDADVDGYGGAEVAKLVAPLLADADLMMVKPTYRRFFHGRLDEGGRVTELLAKPLLARLAPSLAEVQQPLAGETAVRRAALDEIALEPGYGVEIGLLLDVAARFGVGSIAQVDLGERVHRNRPLRELALQAREVLDAVLVRTGA